ncbi:MAG: SoxAX cytochrome complex subunit A [Arcobacter lacus]|nr:MAG: SoxAX cytochrome complex subunit A [Arcobacter lacus]
MLMKLAKTTVLVALASCTLNATDYSAQAEKDRVELVKYFEAKFADPYANKATFFPHSTDDELKNNFEKGLKHDDFSMGAYSYAKDAKKTYIPLKDFPPYELNVEDGEALYNKAFANGNTFAACFPDPAIGDKYPHYSEERGQVVTLTQAVNECLTSNGEKAWNTKKGKMADLQAYLNYATMEEDKVVNVEITSQAAADAYERGKAYYYTQKGYLNLSCAECHVQGTGQRVRNEKLSPLLGSVTHFPVYRLKWQGTGTLERRMSGCVKDQGQVPPKDTSNEMKELLFFMSYMSNGMKIDGPDIRK